jgi:hypothetical protein
MIIYYNVTCWAVGITTLAVETKHSVRDIEVHVTVNCIKILSAAQQCSYGKLMTHTEVKHT